MEAAVHPDFGALRESWVLTLEAEGYSPRTIVTYRAGLVGFSSWLALEAPDCGPTDVIRDQIRAWVVHMRKTVANNTVRARFGGVRHFYRWLVTEGENDRTPFDGVKTPKAGDPHTPVLTAEEVRRLLLICSGTDFVGRRDTAIVMILVDGGLRLSELTGLSVEDVDLRDRIIFVVGKGSNRSGPRRRAVPVGVQAARALDRYLRERRKHLFAERPELWLGSRRSGTLSPNGVQAMLRRKSEKVGMKLHPHMFRHTWASEFRMAGGEEGDLMVLGGWRNRQMLDRYGKAAEAERAHASYRRRSFGDSL